VRVLCDRNVDEQYTETFRRTEWITVTTVTEALAMDALDPEISDFAARNGWVVFTEDDDFLALDDNHGLVLYHQHEKPSPGEVVRALQAIAEAYADHSEIEEYVPSGWL
jgi:predicted nuclease of predicted toxin-antitoxin system